MAKPVVEVIGGRELRAAFKAAYVEAPAILRASSKSASELVVKRALPNVPVGATGRLKGSIKALGAQNNASVKAGNATVNYAAAIHWGRKVGNVGRPPGNHKGPNAIVGRPFLYDAAQASEDEILNEYQRKTDELMATLF